jgi:hypothetical protein
MVLRSEGLMGDVTTGVLESHAVELAMYAYAGMTAFHWVRDIGSMGEGLGGMEIILTRQCAG